MGILLSCKLYETWLQINFIVCWSSQYYLSINHFIYRSRSAGRRSRVRTRQVRKYKKVKPNVKVTDQNQSFTLGEGHSGNKMASSSVSNSVNSATHVTTNSGSHETVALLAERSVAQESCVQNGQTPIILGQDDPEMVC